MDDADAQQARLQDDLRVASEAFSAEYRRLLPEWGLGYRGLRLHAKINSGFITIVYILFNLASFVAGLTFVFFKGAIQALGVSLIVGALFSFGAFVAQFWAVAVGREEQIFDRAFDQSNTDIRYADLQRRAKAVWELYEQLESKIHPDAHAPGTPGT